MASKNMWKVELRHKVNYSWNSGDNPELKKRENKKSWFLFPILILSPIIIFFLVKSNAFPSSQCDWGLFIITDLNLYTVLTLLLFYCPQIMLYENTSGSWKALHYIWCSLCNTCGETRHRRDVWEVSVWVITWGRRMAAAVE